MPPLVPPLEEELCPIRAAIRLRSASSTDIQRTKSASSPNPSTKVRNDTRRLRRRPVRERVGDDVFAEGEEVDPHADADHHEQQVEADQDVDQLVRRAAGARSPGGHRAAGGDRDGDEEQHEGAEPEQGASSRASHRDTLHRLVRRPPIEECWPRPAVMGVVNVTPDSFSDGGDNLDPRDAAATARRHTRRGSRRRRRRGRVDQARLRRSHGGRGAAPGRAGPAGAPRTAGVHRHLEGRRRRQSHRARGRCW